MSRKLLPETEEAGKALTGVYCPLCGSTPPEVVTISFADYSRLLNDSRQLAEWNVSHQQLIGPSKSTVSRDPEVAIFFAQNLGLKPVAALVKECKKRFGAARTPSAKSVYRYWDSLRKKTTIENAKIVAN